LSCFDKRYYILNVSNVNTNAGMLVTQEREHSQKVASLEETIRHKVSAIDGLETEIKRLQHGIGELTKEVEAKNKQIAKIRNEALMSIRYHL
jgi:predicted RNase H-like nuclease (RuvC/YqgF family)